MLFLLGITKGGTSSVQSQPIDNHPAGWYSEIKGTDKAKPLARRGRKAAGLVEDGRAAEGNKKAGRLFYLI